jgi:predicted metal-binding membrane protein
MFSKNLSDLLFWGSGAFLFLSTATITIFWCGSMEGMSGMPMPGGWTMSMTWMPMKGLLPATFSFLGMWTLMMIPMMVPSLMPMLYYFRNNAPLTLIVGIGYFLIWALAGLLIFPAGLFVSKLMMRSSGLSRTEPILIACFLVAAGLFQMTAWKAKYLNHCRASLCDSLKYPKTTGKAFRYGIGLGVNCFKCCLGQMSLLLVLGVMDLRVMGIIMAAVLIERLAPQGERLAKCTGSVSLAIGVLLLFFG